MRPATQNSLPSGRVRPRKCSRGSPARGPRRHGVSGLARRGVPEALPRRIVAMSPSGHLRSLNRTTLTLTFFLQRSEQQRQALQNRLISYGVAVAVERQCPHVDAVCRRQRNKYGADGLALSLIHISEPTR